MCGIAGFVGLDDDALLQSMCASLTHRGPDEAGVFTAPGVGLAARRLAIIDLKTGAQPITNETRDVWVVFNGEIYNFETLREDLLRRGHTLRTTGDTETLVHLYEELGLDFVRRLRGMFGLALWDAKRRRLVLVRDRIGEKPLFYATDGRRLFFGSEIKAILQTGLRREVNAQAVCDYLAAGYVAGESTFFRDVFKLPPGHMLVHEGGRAVVSRYWTPFQRQARPLAWPEATRRLSELLGETVRLCLKSDVEVGGFLSGGIDSSVIVALARRHVPRIRTFSVGYAEGVTGFNELKYARRIAQHFGTDHRELIVDPWSSMELLPEVLWHYDEPHGEPTSILVYLLSEFTKKYVKVALGGTGGDEIFLGYPRHAGVRWLELYRRLPRVIRGRLVERLVESWPESTRGSRFAKRVRRFVAGAELPPAEAYRTWVSLLHEDLRAALLTAEIRADAEHPAGDRVLRRHLTEGDGDALLRRATALDVEAYLPEYQLTYMDRMSMAHGLEVRSPLCDFELVDFVTGLPERYRLRGTRTKHILKAVAKQWLPADIVERRKVGFDSPIGQWFKDELKGMLSHFLDRDRLARSGLLDGQTVQRLVADHLGGRRDYSLQLWSLIALEAWHRMYIEDGVSSPGYRFSDLLGAGAPEGRRPGKVLQRVK